MQIFISYSSADRTFILDLAKRLKADSYSIWLDQHNITGREPYWSEIQHGIESSTHFVFGISPDSITPHSGSMKELLHADSISAERRPHIIPIMVRAVPYQKLPINVSSGIYQIHDFAANPYPVAYHALCTALGSPATPSAPTAIPILEQNKRRNKVALIALGIVLLVGLAFMLVAMLTQSLMERPSQQPTPSAPMLSLNPTATSELPTLTATPTISPTATLTVTPTPTTPMPTLTVTPTNQPTRMLTPTKLTNTPAAFTFPNTFFDVCRSAEAVAICALDMADYSTTEIQIGVNERYVLGDLFPESVAPFPGECWCLQKPNPVFALPSTCMGASTSVQPNAGDWRDTDLQIHYNGAVLTCPAQPDAGTEYMCNLR